MVVGKLLEVNDSIVEDSLIRLELKAIVAELLDEIKMVVEELEGTRVVVDELDETRTVLKELEGTRPAVE